MQRKTFFMGIATGIVASAVALGTMNMASVVINAKDKTFTVTDKMNYIGSILEQNYVEEVDEGEMVEGAFRGMAASIGDPYTTYFTAEEMASFLEDIEGEFCGIGVTVIFDETANCLRVVSVMDGNPAQKAGILAGDYIISVDGEDMRGVDSDTVVSKMKGEAGTEVTVGVQRGEENLSFTMKRDTIEVQSVTGEMRQDGIAYLAISSFNSNTYQQFKKEYDALMAQNPKGLILDLRDNTGGVLEVANEIADTLVGEGTIVYTIDKEGNRQDYTSDTNKIEIPLCVLVNGQSASASEVLSGAVQGNDCGTLVGTQTFGKGLVQQTFGLPDGSALKVTVQKYYTADDVCIQGVGLTPDVVVELPGGLISPQLLTEGQTDTQLEKAAEVILEQAK